MKRKLYLLLWLIAQIWGVEAQENKPFMYIQGDKVCPFYVKVSGRMQERYGKNYCIIPQLEKGVDTIEILFEQNRYPPQTYVIKVDFPKNRSYLLVKKEGKYRLYESDTKTYVEPVKE